MTARSFSLGRPGEAQWERLRAAYVLSQRSGVIVLVASDSRDVRDEVRRRVEAMAPRVAVIEPGKGVTQAVHELARSGAEGEKLPVAWIEAPKGASSPAEDMQWIDALVVLNQTRDALQMHGPCHVVLAGPRALHELVRRRAPDLASLMSTVLLLDDTLENLVTQQGSLTWMHLSDLHVKGESWQQDHVLGALLRDLPQLLEERGLRPDLLFVTGDVAAGGRRAEYDGAFIVIDELTKQLGLERREHVFVVPGNHDVDRGKIGGLAKRDHASLLKLGPQELRDAVGELLGDAKEFVHYGERLEEWCAFTEKLVGRARSVSLERPWRSDVVEVGGLLVGVLSLCTAWASGPEDRKGSLILGERQLHEMVAEARDGGAQLVVALMHHPMHWLHDGEHSAIRGRLERDVDIVLHGHVHEAHTELHVAAGAAHVEIGAGAAYGGLGQDPYHGFSVGRLDLAEGRLDVHCFTWSTRSGKWHADSGTPGADDHGRVSFPFTPAGVAPDVLRVGGHEVLAARLRHAAAKVYATVDFAGLGAGGPRRHVTLEQIFVPLRLTSMGLTNADSQCFEPDEEPPVENDDLVDHDWTEYERDLEYEFRDEISRPVTLAGVDAMLSSGGKVVVLGGPGSGKSTLAKYLVSTIAGREEGLVPLLLTVRDWIAEGKGENLLDMAARQASAVLSVRTDREALEALCADGRVLLVVDGLDEAADAAVRRDLRDRLHGFVARYPRVPVLVTSRIAGYHEVSLDGDFDHLTLDPFDDAALEEFVHRWYDLVEGDPSERLRKRVDLLHAFEVEPRAKELARNPLLATLIGMVHFSHAQLPGDRAKLYGMMIELLLVTWPAERGRELAELHGTVQQPMLEKLALQLQEQRAAEQKTKSAGPTAEVLIDVATLEEMLEERLAERFPERSTPERRHLARKWGKWLIDGCGVLQEQQAGRVGFLHLSLMEYLAGRALLERSLGGGYEPVAELVAERHDQAVWRETLLLMLGSENKKRELGQAVVERLLEAEPGVLARWSACMFGLALLREEVDLGALRVRLLDATRSAAVTVWAGDWDDASHLLADVVRFSRTHGEAARSWLKAELVTAVGEPLVGVWALASAVFRGGAIDTWLSARADVPSAVAALLDLGPLLRPGRWARQHATRDITLSWACATPLEGVIARSFEGLMGGPASVWIPAFMSRAAWMDQIARSASARHLKEEGIAGRRGLPATISWMIAGEPSGLSRLSPALSSPSDAAVSLRFSRNFSRDFSQYFSRDFLQRLSRHLSHLASSSPFLRDFTVRLFAQDFGPTFTRDFASTFTRDFASTFTRDFAPTFTRDFAPTFTRDFASTFARHFAWHFFRVGPRYFSSEEIIVSTNAPDRPPSTGALWARLRAANSDDEIPQSATLFLTPLLADAHAALVTAQSLHQPEVATALADLRVQNRWLNLFFTPLVDYAIATRPLPDHPDLHALLLTYGLIQYQTTWEWPDCPHWRSWFSAPPPAHWLPAHVYHLVRSIQDPTNPSHRAEADACLDRNDWPELAQALRDNTLVPTPPEVLALFDHGEPPPE